MEGGSPTCRSRARRAVHTRAAATLQVSPAVAAGPARGTGATIIERIFLDQFVNGSGLVTIRARMARKGNPG